WLAGTAGRTGCKVARSVTQIEITPQVSARTTLSTPATFLSAPPLEVLSSGETACPSMFFLVPAKFSRLLSPWLQYWVLSQLPVRLMRLLIQLLQLLHSPRQSTSSIAATSSTVSGKRPQVCPCRRLPLLSLLSSLALTSSLQMARSARSPKYSKSV